MSWMLWQIAHVIPLKSAGSCTNVVFESVAGFQSIGEWHLLQEFGLDLIVTIPVVALRLK